MSSRLSREKLFMHVAFLYGERSSCVRAKVGVVAVREGRIVAAGYCGAPQSQPHCLDVGCDLEDDRCVRTVHAEANLVAWAARTGTPLEGCEVYCTYYPCYTCAKLIANAIGSEGCFIYNNDYHDNDERVRSVLNVIPFQAFLVMDDAAN